MTHNNPAAIVGLGITEIGKIYGRSTADFAADAILRACGDAGLALYDLDGLLTNSGLTPGLGLPLSRDLGLQNLRLLSEVQGYGSSAGAMVAIAAMAVKTGTADVVACVFADAPLKSGTGIGAAYENSAPRAARLRRNARCRRVSRREPLLCARGQTTHDQRTARPASSSARSPSRPALGRAATHSRRCATRSRSRTTRHPAGRRPAAPIRLLPGVQRRRRSDRDQCRPSSRSGKPAGAHPRTGHRPTPDTAWSAGASSASSPAPHSPGRPRYRWQA